MYICTYVQFHFLLFDSSMVQAPSKLTTLRCFPRCNMILISDISPTSCGFVTGGLHILTATVVLGSHSRIPTAVANTTRPNAPEPIWRSRSKKFWETAFDEIWRCRLTWWPSLSLSRGNSTSSLYGRRPAFLNGVTKNDWKFRSMVAIMWILCYVRYVPGLPMEVTDWWKRDHRGRIV